MGNELFMTMCKQIIKEYIREHTDKTDEPIQGYDVYIVWVCKALQNYKALVSTSLPDGMYYEITYNGDKKEFYLDAYKKFENQCIQYEKAEEFLA